MSHRRHDAGYRHHRPSTEERELSWYTAVTVSTAPMMPRPLPGERENSWTIHEVLAEIARLKPTLDEAKRLHFEQRRAAMPGHLKDLLARKAEEAEKLASLTKAALEADERAPRRLRGPARRYSPTADLELLAPLTRREARALSPEMKEARRKARDRIRKRPKNAASRRRDLTAKL